MDVMKLCVGLQHQAEALGMRITAMAIAPKTLKALQKQVADDKEQPEELKGIQFTAWYPETLKYQQNQAIISMLQRYFEYLKANNIGVNNTDGDLTSEKYSEVMLNFLGIDNVKLNTEQTELKKLYGTGEEDGGN